MALIIELPLSDRFSFLIKGLLSDVVAEVPMGWVAVPLIKLLWWRLRRMSARFASIMAQYEAGTLPAPGAARRPPAPAGAADAPSPADASSPAAGSSPPAEPHPPAAPRPLELPRRVGWVTQKINGAEVWADELKAMLADPRVPAAVAEAPQLGRVLRPACRMFGVKLPPWLRLPCLPRVRPPRPSRRRVIPPAPDWAVNAPGAILKPDGTVWQRWGASTLWRPGDPGTLEEAQKFDRPRQIWPRWD